jgi:hypothetical protein
MAFKNDPLKDRQKSKSFFVDAELKPEPKAEVKKEEPKQEKKIEEEKVVQNANRESQIAKQEMQNANHNLQNTQKDEVVYLSSRVYKSQDKWLDLIIEKHREIHGRKLIKKEDLVRAAINLLKTKNIDLHAVKSEEDLNRICLS